MCDVCVLYVMCAVPHQVVLCKSLRDTSSRLAELGWLHNKVRKYTDARSLDRAFGLVGQVCLEFARYIHNLTKFVPRRIPPNTVPSVSSIRASVPRSTRS